MSPSDSQNQATAVPIGFGCRKMALSGTDSQTQGARALARRGYFSLTSPLPSGTLDIREKRISEM
jgi:hypothetical protein